jgi:hypothetical protein
MEKKHRKTFYFLKDEVPTANKDDDVSDTGNTHSDLALPYSAPFEPNAVSPSVAIQDYSSESSEDEVEIDYTQNLMQSLKLAPSMLHDNARPKPMTPIPPTQLIVDSISPKDFVHSILDLFVEEGNVQMNVFLILTLNQKEDLTHYPLEEYLEAYIELLQHYQLFSQATRIMNSCREPSIKNLNSQNTTFYTSCYSCTTSISVNSPTPSKCPKCSTPLTKCSFW